MKETESFFQERKILYGYSSGINNSFFNLYLMRFYSELLILWQ